MESTNQNDAPRIVLYTTTWCGDCRRAKRRLDALGVAYEEIDIDEHPETVDLVRQHNDGKRRIPTIFVDGVFYPELPDAAVLTGEAGERP